MGIAGVKFSGPLSAQVSFALSSIIFFFPATHEYTSMQAHQNVAVNCKILGKTFNGQMPYADV